MANDTATLGKGMPSAFAGRAWPGPWDANGPLAWRGDRILIMLFTVALHSSVWWLWNWSAARVTAPQLLNSVEVALVSQQPAPRVAPPVSQPVVDVPWKQAPRRTRAPRPKVQSKADPHAAPRPEPEQASAPPSSASSETAPVPAQAPSAPFVEANYRADYLHNPPPAYPAIARERHWQGVVVLRVQVLLDGTAGEVNIERGSGHEVLDETAVEAARRWNFVPAKRGDEVVASWVLIPIEFKLRN